MPITFVANRIHTFIAISLRKQCVKAWYMTKIEVSLQDLCRAIGTVIDRFPANQTWKWRAGNQTAIERSFSAK